MEKTIQIKGMMCEHCQAAVKKALEELPFVESAAVSHETGTAILRLSGAWDQAAVKAAIEAKEYTFIGVE